MKLTITQLITKQDKHNISQALRRAKIKATVLRSAYHVKVTLKDTNQKDEATQKIESIGYTEIMKANYETNIIYFENSKESK